MGVCRGGGALWPMLVLLILRPLILTLAFFTLLILTPLILTPLILTLGNLNRTSILQRLRGADSGVARRCDKRIPEKG